MSGNVQLGPLRRCLAVLLCTIVFSLSARAGAERPDLSQYHVAKIVSVRELRNSFPIARWSGIHDFTLHFSVQDSDHVNCYEFRSVILEDVNDLKSSSGHQIRMVQHGNKLNAILEDGRPIKADLTKPDQCPL
jgi:hypothetical protein